MPRKDQGSVQQSEQLSRRRFVQTAAGVAAAGGLAGCSQGGSGGSGNGNSADGSGGDGGGTAASGSDNSGDTLKIMTAYTSDAAKSAYQQVNDQIGPNYPDTNISMNYTGFDNLFERLVSAGSTGDWPDLVLFISPNQSVSLRSDDLTRNPTELMEGIMEEIGEFMDDVPKTQYQTETGELYQMPMNNQADVSWYRTDLLEEIDEEMPETWEDELRVTRKLDEADNDLYGIGMSVANNGYTDTVFHGRLTGAGGYLLDPEGNIVVDSQYTRDTLEHWGKLAEYGPPGIDSWSFGEVYTNFASKQVASAFYWGRTIVNVRDISPEIENDINCIEHPIPDTDAANPSNRATGLVDAGIMPKGNDNVEMSEDWFGTYLSGDTFVNSVMRGVPGNTIPMYPSHNEEFQNFEVWNELEHGEEMRDTLFEATRNAHPRVRQSPDHPTQPRAAVATNNEVYASAGSKYWAGNISADEAAQEMQRQTEQALDD